MILPCSTSQLLSHSDIVKTSCRTLSLSHDTSRHNERRQRLEAVSGNNNHVSSIKCGWKRVRATHTSAESVGPSEDPTLLDLSERGEHDPDVVLVALLRHHADEQLPVFHRCRAEKEDRETVWAEDFTALYIYVFPSFFCAIFSLNCEFNLLKKQIK